MAHLDRPVVIDAAGVGKRYRLGERRKKDTLTARLVELASYPARNLRRLRQLAGADRVGDTNKEGFIWALRDLTFSVRQGDVLGIIGHNGAGKSTLLKILSRITDPTTGYIDISGRISSLLEVGTGFHEELTGRDNVYLNGTILGMRRAEVARKFAEIVAFSGVEKHIDTPVKFYSSGMKVRLAFAVAAHLEPEMLIIDEVLAVGDLAFQEKCLGKMETVSQSGRTVLFVSHNMGAVEGLCHRCMLMQNGEKAYDGSVEEAIRRYRQASLARADAAALGGRTDRDGEGNFRFRSVEINQGEGVAVGLPLVLELGYHAVKAVDHLQIAVKFCRNFRETILTVDSRTQGARLGVQAGEGCLRIEIPRFDLLPGQYFIDLWAGSMTAVEDRIFNATVLTVADRDLYGSGNALIGGRHGIVAPPRCDWQLYQKGI